MTDQSQDSPALRVGFRKVLVCILAPWGIAGLFAAPFFVSGLMSFDMIKWIAVPAQLLGVLLVARLYRWNRKDLGLVIGSRNSIIRASVYCLLIGFEGFFFWNILIPTVGLNALTIGIALGGIYYLLVAICEELWARGVVYKSIVSWRGEIAAVLVSSIIFGLSHFQMTPIGWLRTGIWGLGMAAIRWRTSTTIPQIALHFWVNFNGLIIITAQPALPFHLLVAHMVANLLLVITIVLVDRFIVNRKTKPLEIHALG